MRVLYAAGLLLALSLPVSAREHDDAMMNSTDVLNALRPEIIEGDDVSEIVKALREFVEIDETCDGANKAAILYDRDLGRVALGSDDRVCAVITGPSDGIRHMILKIRGQPA